MFVWKNYRKIVIVVAVMLLLFGTAHAKQDNPNAYAWVESLTENRIGVIACNLSPSGYASFVTQNFTAVHDLSGEGKIYQLEYVYKDSANCYHWVGGWTPWKTGNYTLFGGIDDYYTYSQYAGTIHVNQLKLFLSIITFWR